MHKYRFRRRKYYYLSNSRRTRLLALKFFTTAQSPPIIYSKVVLSPPSDLPGLPPTGYKRTPLPISFFGREESFPREEGRTGGNSSTFLSEFFLIREGRFSLRLTSPSTAPTKTSKFKKTAAWRRLSWIAESFLSSWVSLTNSSTTRRSSPRSKEAFCSLSYCPFLRKSCCQRPTRVKLYLYPWRREAIERVLLLSRK